MRRLLLPFLLLVIGCGGGGGGGGASSRSLGDTCPGDPAGNLHYVTNWGSAPSDASQVIAFYDAAGSVVYSDSLERTNGSELTVPSFPASVYELRVSLYSGPSASGTLLGVSSSVVDLCAYGSAASVTVQTSYAEAATSLRVSPGAVHVKQQQTQRFVVSGLGKSRKLAFLAPNSIGWSSSGGIGTIGATGVFTATAAGTGSVTATSNSLGLLANAQVTVDAFNPHHGKWTVLVYLNAANDLWPAASLNVNQMEAVAGNPDVRFVVQWKESKSYDPSSSFDGVRRYLVLPDNDTNTIHSQLVQDHIVDGLGRSLDMGSPQTMLDFINWGKLYYPADHYVLVIWNHGNGWKPGPLTDRGRGFSYDDEYGTHIDTWQLDQALGSNHFDIVAWDASLMQMIEVAYELRNHADYVAGSEESPPAEGYPYDAVFQGFRDTPDASPATLSKGFVDGMVNDPNYTTRKITQSVLDTSKLDAVATALDGFGHSLFDNKATIAAAIQTARANAQKYSDTTLPPRHFRDIYNLCELFLADGTVPSDVKTAASAVQSAVTTSIVWEGHNNNSPGSHGLSIDFSAGADFQSYRSYYIQMKFAIDTYWDEFLGVAP